jgi:hypothetical protein
MVMNDIGGDFLVRSEGGEHASIFNAFPSAPKHKVIYSGKGVSIPNLIPAPKHTAEKIARDRLSVRK